MSENGQEIKQIDLVVTQSIHALMQEQIFYKQLMYQQIGIPVSKPKKLPLWKRFLNKLISFQ